MVRFCTIFIYFFTKVEMAAAATSSVTPSERAAIATKAILDSYKKTGRTPPEGGIITTSSDPELARVEELRSGTAASSSPILTNIRLEQMKRYGVKPDADFDSMISWFHAFKIPPKDYKTAFREWSKWAHDNDVVSRPQNIIRNPSDETDDEYTSAHNYAEELAYQIEVKYDRITEDLGDQTRGLEARINKIEEYNERIKRLEHIVEDCCGSRGRYNRHTKRNKTLKISRQK